MTAKWRWSLHQGAVARFDAWANHPKRKQINSCAGSLGLLLLAGSPLGLIWAANGWFKSLEQSNVISTGLSHSFSLWLAVGFVLGLTPVLNWGLDFFQRWLGPKRFQPAQLAVDTEQPCDAVFKKRCLNLQARGVLDHHFNPIEWRLAHWLWSGALEREENERYLDAVLPDAHASNQSLPRARL